MEADVVATVVALWRYPVKSLQGEPIEQIRIGSEGLEGDRRWAIFDRSTGFGITARRRPELLHASARLGDDGDVRITLPDGRVCSSEAELSEWLGAPVELRRADEPGERRYEDVADFEHEDSATWGAFDGSPGAFHDLASASVSLLATSTISGWDSRRFRANVLLDMPAGENENALVGKQVTLGGAHVSVRRLLGRCVVVTRPQAGGVERDLDVLRTINRERGGKLAVGAVVVQSGAVSVGDEVRVLVSDALPG